MSDLINGLLGYKLSGTAKSPHYPKKITIPPLKSGESKTFKIILSQSLAKKYKTMHVKADYNNEIFETTKSDNYIYIFI